MGVPTGAGMGEDTARLIRPWLASSIAPRALCNTPSFAPAKSLLFNLAGGSSGAVLSPKYAVAAAQAEPAPPALPAKRPSIAIFSMSPQFSRGIESSGWLRWLLDRWGVDYRDVSAEGIAAGGLAGAEVLLVPDGYALKDPAVPSDPYGYKDLGPKGRDNDFGYGLLDIKAAEAAKE